MLGTSAKLASIGAPSLKPQDVFATSLYTGNGSTQTITNGINLSGVGGLVWTKIRGASGSHFLTDTIRGNTKALFSNTMDSEGTTTTGITAFNNNGYSLGSNGNYNPNTFTAVGWTFRRAPRFFDVVTYTGNGVVGVDRQISHTLGVVPGLIILKRVDQPSDWWVTFPSIIPAASPNFNRNHLLLMNTTDAKRQHSAPASSAYLPIFSSSPHLNTGTHFLLNDGSHTNGLGSPGVPLSNISGATYVAYLFAHDTDSSGIVQCGSYTGNGSTTGPTVTLGWRPQFLLVKNTSDGANWAIHDAARSTSNPRRRNLYPNVSNAEYDGSFADVDFNSTSFQIKNTDGIFNTNGQTYIYLAIREPI